jgi:hypothetical protein
MVRSNKWRQLVIAICEADYAPMAGGAQAGILAPFRCNISKSFVVPVWAEGFMKIFRIEFFHNPTDEALIHPQPFTNLGLRPALPAWAAP